MLGWERWHGSERQQGPPLRLQLAVPGHTGATSLQLAAASNSCSALTHYFIMLPLILSFLYIHRYSCTNHSSTMQPAPSAWPCPFSLLGQRVNSSRLLSTKTGILLSSTTFLLTFWYPVKYSLKTPNYASFFFSCLSSFSQKIWHVIASSLVKLARIHFCVHVSVHVCV